MGRYILFQVTKGNLILLFFSQRVNSIRGHESSLVVHRTYFKGDETI